MAVHQAPRPWDSPGKNTGVGCHSFSNAWKWKVKVKSFSCVQLTLTPWTTAHQAPPSMGFSRQKYCKASENENNKIKFSENDSRGHIANEDTFIQDNLLKLFRILRLCGIWTKICRLPLPLISKRYTLHLLLLQPRVQGYVYFPISSWRAIFLGETGQRHFLTWSSYILLKLSSGQAWLNGSPSPFQLPLMGWRLYLGWCTTESLSPDRLALAHGVGVSTLKEAN